MVTVDALIQRKQMVAQPTVVVLIQNSPPCHGLLRKLKHNETSEYAAVPCRPSTFGSPDNQSAPCWRMSLWPVHLYGTLGETLGKLCKTDA
jgi:hypothetical protein